MKLPSVESKVPMICSAALARFSPGKRQVSKPVP